MTAAFRSDMEAAIWKRAQSLQRVHWTNLVELGVARTTAKIFVRRWAQAGLLTRIDTGDHRKVYAFADQGPQPEFVPEYDESAEGNMWRSMRGLRQFSATDIAAHSNAGGVQIPVQKARAYCRLLLQSGHLRVQSSAVPGKREPRYRLVNNTGPVAPKPRQIKGVFDANTADFTSLDKEILL